MTKLNPSMRLKVKRDTFFIPELNGSVYFRNNFCSFRIEGTNIDQWIEKLIPMFNGDHTLENLTDGLPDQYRNQVYKIAEMLYKNGFVRDKSQDRPHQLSDKVLEKYTSQIEFLENLSDSGAYRFQSYRQAKVLTIGSGPFFVSLVSALLKSGLPKFCILNTDSVSTNRQRIEEVEVNARKTDPEVVLKEIPFQKEKMSSWRDVIQPFDWILYVSHMGEIEEIQVLQAVCREEKKVLLPAMILQQAGFAGPMMYPNAEECWESAWRRLHLSALCKDPQLHTFSYTAGAILANVIVFELFKTVAGVTENRNNQFFLLDLETMEGNWHSFFPHPLVTGRATVKWVQDLDLLFKQASSSSGSGKLLFYFSLLTSKESGIFHIWEEGDLKQLPLAQCCVQVTDPMSEGPAELLPDMICTGLTHEEARREAGLTGVEAYVAQMVCLLVARLPSFQETWFRMVDPNEFIGVGVGETVAEGISRGLQKCLADELKKQQAHKKPPVFPVQLNTVEDEHCRFYLQALTTMQGVPIIGLGAELCGFPVVWVSTGDRWYGSVGFNVTRALRNSLQQALSKAQNKVANLETQALEVSSVLLKDKGPENFRIPVCGVTVELDILKDAFQVLKQNHKQLLVFNLVLEPFLKEGLAGAFGVLVREEES